MAIRINLTALIAGFGLWLMLAAAPSAAIAGGNCCSPPSPPPPCNCTPPPCCTPPTPPPSSPPCCSPGHDIVIPGVNVFVAPSVVVNVSASANASAGAVAQGQTAAFVSGGGGGFVSAPGPVGAINGLNVEGERRSAFEATRSRFEKVVIQAFCFDDKDVPHPASQTAPDRDIDENFEGELYRCIAGTHMQVTIAKWNERVSFEGGQTIACAKGEALWHSPGHGGGRLECRPQKPARDCNERSLLRRFGAGVKVLTILITEKYTAYREETRESSVSAAMSLDGGVGGVVY
ncbi:MAG: hypothetical protein ACHP7N_05495 [Caulobacterales bacterium]